MSEESGEITVIAVRGGFERTYPLWNAEYTERLDVRGVNHDIPEDGSSGTWVIQRQIEYDFSSDEPESGTEPVEEVG